MDTVAKLTTIATQMHLEVAEEVGLGSSTRTALAPCGVPIHKSHKRESLGIYDAQIGGGKSIPLLKTMQTTACERNCAYCPFRAGRNFRRTTFKPDEMADSFMRLYQAGMVQGIFLSSGIIRGGVTTQDKMLDTIDILRRKRGFRGYVHLKLIPGVEKAQVERAMQLADRLSVNLEAPTADRLRVLAPMKQLVEELVTPLTWVEEIRRSTSPRNGWNGHWPSTVTQFVVGAAEDTDVELLKATQYLYRRLHLRRSYFSAFSPIHDTPLENVPAEDPRREHRLYQASFLLRDYGFDLEDLHFKQSGKLPLDVDPKMAWAEAHLAHAPVELNRADREALLRVPGIGPKSAETILHARRIGKLRDLRHLQQLGIATKRLQHFVLLDGVRPTRQLYLF